MSGHSPHHGSTGHKDGRYNSKQNRYTVPRNNRSSDKHLKTLHVSEKDKKHSSFTNVMKKYKHSDAGRYNGLDDCSDCSDCSGCDGCDNCDNCQHFQAAEKNQVNVYSSSASGHENEYIVPE